MPQRVPQLAGATPPGGLTRRAFLSTSMALAAAAGTEFVTGQAPALAQTRTLHVLEWSSFVPAADVIRDQQAAEFGKQAGVKVTIEHINANDLLARATAAIEGRKGPDILQLLNNNPHLYAGGLEDHNQLIAELGGNKFYPFLRDAVTVDGVVRGVPYFFGGGANTYRKDIFQKVGIDKLPDTWEEHLAAGKKLKKFGMPIGQNVELEFVDTTGTGEYRLTRDPGEKDALAHVPGAGPSALEAMGLKSKVDRFTNTDGTTLPAPLGPRPASMNEFESLGRYYRVLGPPPPIQDLHPGVFSRVIRNQINLAYDLAFLRATADSTIVPITLQIPNNQMGFRSKDGIHSAILNVYARITTPGGRLVQSFEEAIGHDVPDSLFEKDLSRSLLFQKSLPLHPGLYRLDVVVKDVESGNVGLIGTALRVPQYEEGVLNASSLILADKIEPVPSKEFGLGQFVLGAYKVRPRLAHTFSNAENLGIFLQLYNLKTDEILDATSVAVTYRLLRDKQQIWSSVESSGSIRRDGEQITLNRRLPLAAFAPGHYRLEIKVQDNFSHQIVTRTADFEIALPSSSR